jgi:hypothetical protein
MGSLSEEARLILRVIEEHPEFDGRKCSRLAQMAVAVLRGQDAIIPPTRPDFPLVVQATKDLAQFWFIWHVLKPSPTNAALWRRVGNLFADDPLPSRSSDRKDARRDQFELFCEAMLVRCGFEPIHQRVGPDFACSIGPRRFVVEAKTARSVRAVRERLLEGASQVCASEHPGFIFLDYTFAVNERRSEHAFASAEPLRRVGEAQRARFRALRTRVFEPTRRALEESRVVGVGYIDQLVIQDGRKETDGSGNWQLALFRDHVLVPCGEADGGLGRSVFELLTHGGLPVGPNKD